MIWSALPWVNIYISRTIPSSAGGGRYLAKLCANRVHGEYNLIIYVVGRWYAVRLPGTCCTGVTVLLPIVAANVPGVISLPFILHANQRARWWWLS